MTTDTTSIQSGGAEDAKRRVDAVRDAFPKTGLFAEKEWLISPEAFAIDEKMEEELHKLGYRLYLFQKACNLLYQLSAQGRQPAWVAEYLDAGKPPELIELSREKILRDEVPLVIRPDVILTDEGYTIAELDSVPGGIGLTAWLNQTYAGLGERILGGAEGMMDGFRSILPSGAIAISDEAATYRPEMEWLVDQLNQKHGRSDADTAGSQNWRVTNEHDVSTIREKRVYRFFEHFDLPNVPIAKGLMKASREGSVSVTPPFKPYMEEKMWFALFWMQPLREFWRREIGERQWLKLQKVIPYTWIMDPADIPHHAVIPELNINRWEEMTGFGGRKRELIIKISGYSPLAWGSRGVDLAADLTHAEWKSAIHRALERFSTNPMIVQKFHKGRLVKQSYWNEETKKLEVMKGRVRLCPYYFVKDGRTDLGGALATVCPADKKLLHGMRDAIIVPTSVRKAE